MRLKKLKSPSNLGDAVLLVAHIGGYLGLGRKKDPPPGHQLMWQGYTALQRLCEGYLLSVDGEESLGPG